MDYDETIKWVWGYFGRPIRFTVLVDGRPISSMTAVVQPPEPSEVAMGGDWGPYPSVRVIRGVQHLSFTLNDPEGFLGAAPWGDGLKLRFGRKSFLRRREIAELIIVPHPDGPTLPGEPSGLSQAPD